MAAEWHDGSVRGARADGPGRLVFRCHACEARFRDDPAGPGCCPRCGAIGGHDRLGRTSGGAG